MKRAPVIPLLVLLPLGACKTPDYMRVLGPGEPALLWVDIERLDLPLEQEWNARDEILPALDRSIHWTQRKHAEQFFPSSDIEYARARASLERFRELLTESSSGEDFADSFVAEFDAYVSAGWNGKGGGVLFTGYCTPILPGSLERTERFCYPLYAKPEDLEKDKSGKTLGWRTASGLVPYPTRKAIEAGSMLEGKGLELAWLEDPIDAYIAHVNGSAFIELENGEMYKLGYSAKNGRSYTSLGKELVDDGVVPKEKMNLAAIREWGERASPTEVTEYLQRNESYVFFQPIDGNPHGSLDEEVTAERSVATDKTLFPRGALVLIEAELPSPDGGEEEFEQFLFDQDTGGAIRTPGRADIYFGIGPEAEQRAGQVQSPGQIYYFFLKEVEIAPTP